LIEDDESRTLIKFLYTPSVKLRGSRSYVHSTTLYNEFMTGAAHHSLTVEGPIALVTRQLIFNQPEFAFNTSLDSSQNDARALFSFTSRGVGWNCVVSEGLRLVVQSEPYDESRIRECAVIHEDTIRIGKFVGARSIEVVTSLTLLLHEKMFRIPNGKKWFLARLRLSRALTDDDAGLIAIRLLKHVGLTLTRSGIWVDSEQIGHIEFMTGDIQATAAGSPGP
jgi:hypothetical protein